MSRLCTMLMMGAGAAASAAISGSDDDMQPGVHRSMARAHDGSDGSWEEGFRSRDGETAVCEPQRVASSATSNSDDGMQPGVHRSQARHTHHVVDGSDGSWEGCR